ncbi:hypothetical protein D3C72_1809510 [compost metagenome]
MPSLANRVSISIAATPLPWACSEAIASATLATYWSASCSALVPVGARYRQGMGTARAWGEKGSELGRAVVSSARAVVLPW